VPNVTLPEPTKPHASYRIQKRQNPDWKRVLDLCVVVLITPLLALPLALVVLYIRLVSPGPILFVQSRVGFGGDDFRIYKFRTMHVSDVCRDASHRDYVASYSGIDVPVKKPDYQSELIPGGEWLRKLSIDEIPQLLNVWRGTMSLVGPRPDVLQLKDYESWQLRRFEVLPGMTGLWQVSGKNRLTFDQMIELDLKYVDTRCLSQDLLIMARTVIVLLLDRNE
jgi:lipopolysaccharide/colanic/teichoic acid biosynthesis glycosyltransferase